MLTVESILSKNPVLETERLRRRRAVTRRFSPWLTPQIPDLWSLTLFPFATDRPLCYFHDSSLAPFIDLLSLNASATLEVLEGLDIEITHAIDAIATPSPSWGNERGLELSAAKHYADFEQVWHPEYQRYAEHAFNHLIKVPLALLGRANNKDYVSQQLALRVDRLRTFTNLAPLAQGFEATIRNSIAHGSALFTPFGMLYNDTKNRIELYPEDFSQNFDSLVKSVHTLAVGILLFLLRKWSDVVSFGVQRLPLGLLFLSASGAATHRDFRLRRLISSEIAGNAKQINIICETPVVSRLFHQFVSLHLMKNLEDLGGPRFERAAVSIHCGRRIPSSMFIDVGHLRRARRELMPGSELETIIEGSLLWHDSSSRLLDKLSRIRLVAETVWANHAESVTEEWRRQGLIVARSLYTIRAADNRSVGRLRRIEGRAVLNYGVDPVLRDVRAIGLHAIRRLRWIRIPGKKLGMDLWPTGRPSHVWLFLYKNDDMVRRLAGRVGSDSNVLLEAEWKSKRSTSAFQLVSNPDEVVRGVRLKYALNVG